MMKHVIRMGPAWLRCPLLLIAFPWAFFKGIGMALVDRPEALTQPTFYQAAGIVFMKAWRGEYVPK